MFQSQFYEFVRKDLELAFHKVRTGGFIAGDDYDWGKSEGFPVRRAVQDLIADHAVSTPLEIIGTQFVLPRP
jgi:hypothetical protein